jgi:copper resistance protein C
MSARRSSYVAAFAMVLVGGVLAGAGAPAAMHLALSKAEPGVDSTITTAPTAISLFFTQAPQSGATSIRLMNAQEQTVQLADAKADPADAMIIRAAVTAPIPSGAYQVVWRTLATDGHVVSGDFRFTYRPDS